MDRLIQKDSTVKNGFFNHVIKFDLGFKRELTEHPNRFQIRGRWA